MNALLTVHDISREDAMPRLRSVLCRAGYPGLLTDASPEIMLVAKAAYTAAMEVSSPWAGSWGLRVSDLAPSLLPPKFERCSDCTVLLATLGSGIDERIAERFAAGAPLEAALIDAWGSEAVETLVQNIDRRLRGERGTEGTSRYAPGYGGFDIRNNAKWLDLVASTKRKDNPGGVTANPKTGILSPRKSVLCMIGWGDAPEGGVYNITRQGCD